MTDTGPTTLRTLTVNILLRHGVYTVGEARALPDAELLDIPGVGVGVLAEIRRITDGKQPTDRPLSALHTYRPYYTPRPKRPSPYADRNRAIVKLCEDGETHAAIARRYGITRSRVYQIVAQEKRAAVT